LKRVIWKVFQYLVFLEIVIQWSSEEHSTRQIWISKFWIFDIERHRLNYLKSGKK